MEAPRSTAHYRCNICNHEPAVGTKAEIWSPRLTWGQNARLLLSWARLPEPNAQILALDCFVDADKLLTGWLAKAREVVERVQTHRCETVRLGGMGREVEIDELCFRARWTRPNGE